MDEAAYQKHLNRIIRRLRRYSKHVDVSLVEKAFDFAKEAHKDQLRKSGEPYFDHPVLVAKILTELKMDYVTVIGGLLHDVVEDTGYTLAEVQEQFSSEIAVLVDGVTKISELKFDSVEQRQAENFRKMILSMVNDVRVILINPSEVQTDFVINSGRPERTFNPTKLQSTDIAHTVVAALEMEDRGFITELTVFATNPQD